MDFDLEGRVALLTGASGLIVGALAKGLKEAGCTVIAADLIERNDMDGFVYLDVTKRSSWEEARKTILFGFQKIDILINGAGANAPTPFFEIEEKEWDRILDVQLKGTMFGCQVIGAQMFSQQKGSIINISSASSGPPLSKAFAYSVAKAGVKNLTQNLAREWAQWGVRVNAIRPGFFPSPFMVEHFLTEERVADIMRHTPMNRFGKPEELVGAVLWLASDASSFVTGAEIPIDGGFTAMTI